MKIISKLKDYYDYIPHLYGGGDPKIVYDRRRIGELEEIGGYSYLRDLQVEVKNFPNLYPGFVHKDNPYNFRSENWGFKTLVVCGKPYLLINTTPLAGNPDNWEVFIKDKHSHLVKPDTYRLHRDWGIEFGSLTDLSKKIGHPVFVVNHVEQYHKYVKVTIDGNCPILSSLGFPSLMTAEQLYQDLSYFILNKMKDSPDLQPPTVISDKEKVVQHGFDVKQSFRHRK